MAPGMMLIFSGRRWVIQEIDDRDKVIMVAASKAGTPPIFGGDPGDIHDEVIERMFDVLEGDIARVYMDKTARDLLDEARRQYDKLGFPKTSVIRIGENSAAVATRVGTVKTNTLALACRASGLEVDPHDGFLTVRAKDGIEVLWEVLSRLAKGEDCKLFTNQTNLIFEKFHPYLTRELLELDALSSRIDISSLQEVAREIIAHLLFRSRLILCRANRYSGGMQTSPDDCWSMQTLTAALCSSSTLPLIKDLRRPRGAGRTT